MASVLIVDDIPENLQVLGSLLSDEGLDLSFAVNGKQALDTINHAIPDLILLDVSMPEIDGFEVCRRIRQSSNSKHVPVIFLTAFNDKEHVVKGFEVGGQDYITKPFNHSELLARVNMHLQMQEHQRKLERRRQEVQKLNTQLQQQQQLLQQKNTDIMDSLQYAKILQKSMMHFDDFQSKYLPNSFIYYVPKDIISGDFYYFDKIDENLILIVGDCTGHGVPGALLTVMGISALNQIISTEKYQNPAHILQRLDENFQKILKSEDEMTFTDGMDIGVVVLNLENGNFKFSSAKNTLVLFQNQELNKIRTSSFSVGGYRKKDKKEFGTFETTLQPNDTFYMFSDGYISQFGGPKDKKFGMPRMISMLSNIHSQPLTEQKQYIVNQLESWRGQQEYIDDIIVFGYQYKI